MKTTLPNPNRNRIGYRYQQKSPGPILPQHESWWRKLFRRK